MARLLLFDQRAMDRTQHLIPPAGSPDLWRVTNASESLSGLIEALRGGLLHSPAQNLRIVCHGNSGHLQFSRDGLHQGNVATFGRLRGLIRGAVQIHGCAVARSRRIEIIRVQGIGNMYREDATPGDLNTGWGTDIGSGLAASRELSPEIGRMIRGGQGVQFVIAFSNAIGLPVTGAVHAQWPDRSWQYEGPTVTAWPLAGLFLNISPGDSTFGANLHGSYQIPM